MGLLLHVLTTDREIACKFSIGKYSLYNKLDFFAEAKKEVNIVEQEVAWIFNALSSFVITVYVYSTSIQFSSVSRFPRWKLWVRARLWVSHTVARILGIDYLKWRRCQGFACICLFVFFSFFPKYEIVLVFLRFKGPGRILKMRDTELKTPTSWPLSSALFSSCTCRWSTDHAWS